MIRAKYTDGNIEAVVEMADFGDGKFEVTTRVRQGNPPPSGFEAALIRSARPVPYRSDTFIAKGEGGRLSVC